VKVKLLEKERKISTITDIEEILTNMEENQENNIILMIDIVAQAKGDKTTKRVDMEKETGAMKR
jgi:anionic cell wall polymer biosynthesis LytR-Cps2A-Psr (LCP) family protein